MDIQSVIAIEFKEAKPEMKWLFVRLLHNYFGQQPFRLPYKELAKTFNISNGMIKKSLDYFVKHKLLERKKLALDNGSYSHIYNFNFRDIEELTSLLGESKRIQGCDFNHSKIVSDLIAGEIHVDLRASTKLLLAVLLSYADEFGVVGNLGTSDITKLTGMGKNRLSSQLKKLSEANKIIKYKTSGINWPNLFGLMKTVYFLNTNTLKFPLKTKIYLLKMESDESFEAEYLINLSNIHYLSKEDSKRIKESRFVKYLLRSQDINLPKESRKSYTIKGVINLLKPLRMRDERSKITLQMWLYRVAEIILLNYEQVSKKTDKEDTINIGYEEILNTSFAKDVKTQKNGGNEIINNNDRLQLIFLLIKASFWIAKTTHSFAGEAIKASDRIIIMPIANISNNKEFLGLRNKEFIIEIIKKTPNQKESATRVSSSSTQNVT